MDIILNKIEHMSKTAKNAYVYLISDGVNIKIGVSQNPSNRLKTMQTGNASKLELLWSKCYMNPYAVEASIHNMHFQNHVIGEWFNLSSSSIEEVKNTEWKDEELKTVANPFLRRVEDGYFSASVLINSVKGTSKSTRHYKERKSTKEFIKQLQGEGVEKPYLSSNKGVWMHPKLFIDFAMYVSVKFKSKVIDYVLDGLLTSRTEAGDYYNEMCAEILKSYYKYKETKPPYYIYSNEANLVRKMVTDKKDRNEMTEQELKQITYLQKVNAMLMQKGIGKDSRIKRLQEANEISI